MATVTREEAVKIVEDAILEQLYIPPTEYELSSTLKTLGGDSLDLVEITLKIEEKITCQFPQNLVNFQTIEDIVKYVEICPKL